MNLVEIKELKESPNLEQETEETRYERRKRLYTELSNRNHRVISVIEYSVWLFPSSLFSGYLYFEYDYPPDV